MFNRYSIYYRHRNARSDTCIIENVKAIVLFIRKEVDDVVVDGVLVQEGHIETNA